MEVGFQTFIIDLPVKQAFQYIILIIRQTAITRNSSVERALYIRSVGSIPTSSTVGESLLIY